MLIRSIYEKEMDGVVLELKLNSFMKYTIILPGYNNPDTKKHEHACDLPLDRIRELHQMLDIYLKGCVDIKT